MIELLEIFLEKYKEQQGILHRVMSLAARLDTRDFYVFQFDEEVLKAILPPRVCETIVANAKKRPTIAHI